MCCLGKQSAALSRKTTTFTIKTATDETVIITTMNRVCIILAIACLGAPALCLKGQGGIDFSVQQFSIDQGLSQSTALSIYQDTFGLMWIGRGVHQLPFADRAGQQP